MHSGNNMGFNYALQCNIQFYWIVFCYNWNASDSESKCTNQWHINVIVLLFICCGESSSPLRDFNVQ